MAITPPIMKYPLGTDYYDVEIFNTNWKNTLTHADMLFENGVGADVLGYIEDGGTHTVGEVWLSKYNKGEFKCLETNIDDFIATNKWVQIDDLTNANKIKLLNDYTVVANVVVDNINFKFQKVGKTVTVYINSVTAATIFGRFYVFIPTGFIPTSYSISVAHANNTNRKLEMNVFPLTDAIDCVTSTSDNNGTYLYGQLIYFTN